MARAVPIQTPRGVRWVAPPRPKITKRTIYRGGGVDGRVAHQVLYQTSYDPETKRIVTRRIEVPAKDIAGKQKEGWVVSPEEAKVIEKKLALERARIEKTPLVTQVTKEEKYQKTLQQQIAERWGKQLGRDVRVTKEGVLEIAGRKGERKLVITPEGVKGMLPTTARLYPSALPQLTEAYKRAIPLTEWQRFAIKQARARGVKYEVTKGGDVIIKEKGKQTVITRDLMTGVVPPEAKVKDVSFRQEALLHRRGMRQEVKYFSPEKIKLLQKEGGIKRLQVLAIAPVVEVKEFGKVVEVKEFGKLAGTIGKRYIIEPAISKERRKEMRQATLAGMVYLAKKPRKELFLETFSYPVPAAIRGTQRVITAVKERPLEVIGRLIPYVAAGALIKGISKLKYALTPTKVQLTQAGKIVTVTKKGTVPITPTFVTKKVTKKVVVSPEKYAEYLAQKKKIIYKPSVPSTKLGKGVYGAFTYIKSLSKKPSRSIPEIWVREGVKGKWRQQIIKHELIHYEQYLFRKKYPKLSKLTHMFGEPEAYMRMFGKYKKKFVIPKTYTRVYLKEQLLSKTFLQPVKFIATKGKQKIVGIGEGLFVTTPKGVIRGMVQYKLITEPKSKFKAATIALKGKLVKWHEGFKGITMAKTKLYKKPSLKKPKKTIYEMTFMKGREIVSGDLPRYLTIGVQTTLKKGFGGLIKKDVAKIFGKIKPEIGRMAVTQKTYEIVHPTKTISGFEFFEKGVGAKKFFKTFIKKLGKPEGGRLYVTPIPMIPLKPIKPFKPAVIPPEPIASEAFMKGIESLFIPPKTKYVYTPLLGGLRPRLEKELVLRKELIQEPYTLIKRQALKPITREIPEKILETKIVVEPVLKRKLKATLEKTLVQTQITKPITRPLLKPITELILKPITKPVVRPVTRPITELISYLTPRVVPFPKIKPQVSRIKKVQVVERLRGYAAFIKKKGKFIRISPAVPLETALDIGAKATATTLAATFKVRRVAETPIKLRTAQEFAKLRGIFRAYKIRKGMKISLPELTFIQKRRERLGRRQEVLEIMKARKAKLSYFKTKKSKIQNLLTIKKGVGKWL